MSLQPKDEGSKAGLYRLSLAVIFAAVARLLMTLIVFYHSFPPRFQGQGLPPKPRGASLELIEALPLIEYSKVTGEEQKLGDALNLLK